MTLVNEIIQALDGNRLKVYSVSEPHRPLPGEPDLVLIVEGNVSGSALEVLRSSDLPATFKPADVPGIIHVWGS